jgi:S-adenosylmethionine:tRNA ribosyltransferase-isomerase
MIAASQPAQRPAGAKLLVIDAAGEFCHALRSSFLELLRPGDLVIANDAATLPASLRGIHVGAGTPVEVRLAGRRSLSLEDVHEFSAIVFGNGDFRTRTEDRPAPPILMPGDRLALGPLSASIVSLLGHPRLVRLRFEGSPDAIWSGLARHGRPIQYAHLPMPLALWDVWTPIAGPPVAFEPPSAGFTIDWHLVAGMRARRVGFATITHAAGISSTGDPALDARLPFDEPYRISETAAAAIRRTCTHGGRIVAIGTTVVRALEHAARGGLVQAGDGLATQRIGHETRLRIVDVILSGTHEPGASHYELLRAFACDATLQRATNELDSHAYRTHEFGDSVWIENARAAASHSFLSRSC